MAEPALEAVVSGLERLGCGDGLEQVPDPHDRYELLQRNAHWYAKRLQQLISRNQLPPPSELTRRFALTPREAEVASLLADRLTSREVAGRLGIAVNTARRYCESVLRKLGISSRRHVRDTLLEVANG